MSLYTKYYNDVVCHYGVKGMTWKNKKSDAEVAKDVMNGKYGNGADRVERLKKEGYDASSIQKLVNEQSKSSSTKSETKSSSDKKVQVDDRTKQLVEQVIRGKFGNGKDRVSALTKAGHDYEKIQSLVNEKLLGKKKASKLKNPNTAKKESSKKKATNTSDTIVKETKQMVATNKKGR